VTRRPQGLLDTSALVLLARIRDPSALPERAHISAVTLAELSVGPLVTDDPAKRAERLAHVQQAEADFEPLPLDAHAARASARVAADLRRSGREATARTFDAQIAAALRYTPGQ
jgi:tRNA(fMet)-specific endonuclease VapC